MQNVSQSATSDSQKLGRSNVQHDLGKSSTPQSSNSSPTKSETETYSEIQPRFMSDSSDSEEDDVSGSEVESFVIDQGELDEEARLEHSKFLLSPEDTDHSVDPETQARLEALLEAAGIGKLSTGDGKHLADPEVLRRLTSSVSCALDEAAAALTRMRNENPRSQAETRSLVEACTDGDVGTVRKLLGEGRSVHETTEEGESLLSLACSAGYFELAQVLLAMSANVEDRGIKGDCTPLMEASSAGHVEVVRLLINHGADVNAQSSSGNTPLMYACAGGHEEVVRVLLSANAKVEDHNENGHTPLMEAASAGHVGVAKILLEHGAGINTHSNEFKESALTLACYKGHLDMVRFLLEAGADQEHKTDEMHTALMEASMDGHVEVARLLLDSGAQVNMPTDSFESPLTLAACGGHVDLAMLLIERGANIEEVNDEGYTPLMEAAREGHEEMVVLLLSQGANINAQTEETQETALTLACCGGFLEVADILIKAGGDIELGASTPLMEAAQEGHLDLVRYLLQSNGNVRAQTQTGDTALTYACENGHTDVADLLLTYQADLEHESEGGRTPLMKACRAGHLCTVQFLISKGADVNKQTTNNDHTPLSLACAGGHLAVVELLLAHSADPFHKLKDNSTMLIEAAKGGHTSVVQLLLDYPHSIMMTPPPGVAPQPQIPQQQGSLHEVPEAVRVNQRDESQLGASSAAGSVASGTSSGSSAGPKSPAGRLADPLGQKPNPLKSLLRKGRPVGDSSSGNPELQDVSHEHGLSAVAVDIVLEKAGLQQLAEEQILQKQQILEELQRVERELQEKVPVGLSGLSRGDGLGSTSLTTGVLPACPPLVPMNTIPPSDVNLSLNPMPPMPPLTPSPAVANSMLHQPAIPAGFYGSRGVAPASSVAASGARPRGPTPTVSGDGDAPVAPCLSARPTPAAGDGTAPPPPFHAVPPGVAICDRPKAKPVSKKDGKGMRKQQVQTLLQHHNQIQLQQLQHLNQQLQLKVLEQEQGGGRAASGIGGNSAAASPASPSSNQQPPLHPHQQLLVQLQQLEGPTPHVPPNTDEVAHLKQQVRQVLHQKHGLQQIQAMLQQQTTPSMPSELPLQSSQRGNGRVHESTPSPDEDEDEDSPSARVEGASVGRQWRRRRVLDCSREGGECSKSEEGGGESSSRASSEVGDEVAGIEDVTEGSACDRGVSAGAPGSSRSGRVQLVRGPEREERRSPRCSRDSIPGEASGVPVDGMRVVSRTDTPQSSGRVEFFAVPSSGNQVPGAPGQILQESELGYTRPQFQQLRSSGSGGSQMPPSSTHSLGVSDGVPGGAGFRQSNAFQGQGIPSNSLGVDPGVPSGSLPVGNCLQQPITSQVGQKQPPSHQPSQPSTATSSQPACTGHQVQAVATQTPADKKVGTPPMQMATTKGKKARCAQQQQLRQSQLQHSPQSQQVLQNIQQPQHIQQQTHQTNNAFGANITQNFPVESGTANYAVGSSVPSGAQQFVGGGAGGAQCQQSAFSCMDVDSETDSNHDTALTLACAGGHDELVELLLSRGADIEHRDKKGFTPLILAATAGHEKVVDALLKHGADIEAQSERTKDTPLSLACSGGRFEVVDLLLNRGANKEHRNVSDYTPLSLAASGGYINIIKMLLAHGAEINSRTGSKLGISPLMLASMNGHTASVKLLLDMGSDINAQIETNRNTALTLACFQGRHEVVSLLLDRKANVEHRAKTGLTPLMEAASGGFVEVGRVLLDKGADVNAPPVPSSRDTALTIAADKGHARFVELLLSRGAQVEVKNKKGNSPLWLAANGGHLSVVELLYGAGADIDSQDNRKVSCLMAAFRKGHLKVVKWMVTHVTQYPSDQEMTRYIATISDKELLEKAQECTKVIRAAKDQQAAKANKNASSLLAELDKEKDREESKRAAAARRRERKKKKKFEKKKQLEEKKADLLSDDKENTKVDDDLDEKGDEDDDERGPGDPALGDESRDTPAESAHAGRGNDGTEKEEGDSGIDANSQGSCSSGDTKGNEKKEKDKKKKKSSSPSGNNDRVEDLDIEEEMDIRGLEAGMTTGEVDLVTSAPSTRTSVPGTTVPVTLSQRRALVPNRPASARLAKAEHHRAQGNDSRGSRDVTVGEHSGSTSDLTMNVVDQGVSPRSASRVLDSISCNTNIRGRLAYESSRHPAEREDFEATGNETYIPAKGKKSLSNYVHFGEGEATNREINANKGPNSSSSLTSPKQGGKREEGWKEVVRNSCVRSKKVSVPSTAISRVIGRGGSNINAIRAATSAHIEVEKQNKGQGERVITIKGSADATRQAHALITALVKDPEADLQVILPGAASVGVATSSVSKVPSCSGLPPTITWCHDPKTASVANAALAKVKPPGGPGKGPSPGTVSVTNSALPRAINSVVGSTVSPLVSTICGANNAKMGINFPVRAISRGTPPRLAEKRAAAAAAVLGGTKSTMSYTTAITTAGRATKIVTTTTTQTFAAKLTETTAGGVPGNVSGSGQASIPVSAQGGPRAPSVQGSQRVARPQSPRQRQPLLQPPMGATVPVLPPAPSNIQSPKCATSPPVVICLTQGVPTRPGAVGGRYRGNASSAPFPVTCVSSTQCQVVPPSSPVNLELSRGNNTGRRREQQPPLSSPNITTPKEYSLFNNLFGKVTQQTMWGQGNESQSKMNFAGAAASGSSPPTTTSATKFLDSGPPQVDVSKAPGYRGMAARSPVSNSANSPHENSVAPRTTSVPTSDALNSAYSSVPDLVELADSSASMQGATMRQRPVGHGAPTTVRPTSLESPGSLCGRQPRPQTRPSPTVESSNFRPGVFAERDVLPRGALMHLHGHHGPLDAGGSPFPPSSSNFGTENSLLKLVRQRNGNANISQQLTGGEPMSNMPSFQNPGQQTMTHFQQGNSVSGSSVVTTNASIHSRLNPRAPDFSISPLSGQRQQIAFNATPAAYHGTPPPVRQGSGPGLATLLANGGVVPFPIIQQNPSSVGKPHSQVGGPTGNYPRTSPGSHPGSGDSSHHNPNHPAAARWPYMTTAPHHPFHPQAHHRGQGDQVTPGAFPGAVGSHFATLAGLASHHHPGGTPDSIGNVENGNSVHQMHNPGMHLHAVHHPHASPAPPSGSRSPGSDVGQHVNVGKSGSPSVGMEDRRSRPMPIGTERACWKNNYVSGGSMAEQDLMAGGGGGWMQAEASIPWQRQHHQLFGGTMPPHPYGRPPPRDETNMNDSPVDGAYQGMHHPPHHHPHHHLGDGRPPQFPNGSGANVSPMHGGVSAVLASALGGPGNVTDVGVPTTPPTSVAELVMKVDGVGEQSEWETGSRGGMQEVNDKRPVTFDTGVPLQGHHTPVPLQAHQRYRLMIDKDGGPQAEKGHL
ncbi:uncharacterized protein LOC124170897 isoform X3 [Ischnura elegans]|nr:uncharacterized protein LOC124170897 isoform X3 [Ischnura elegans]